MTEQSSPPPKPDFSEKLTDALIKLLVVGSGGSTLYFLYINELPKAAIAGAIAVVSGLLGSFGVGLQLEYPGATIFDAPIDCNSGNHLIELYVMVDCEVYYTSACVKLGMDEPLPLCGTNYCSL